MSAFVITPELIQKINTLMDKGLTKGLGNRVPGEMCVEAAICYALGEPHSDNPSCVSPVLRYFKIGLNDFEWSSPRARAQGLRRLAIAQLGTKENFNEREFLEKVICIILRKIDDSKLPQEWINWKKDYLANRNRSNIESARTAARVAYATTRAAACAADTVAHANVAYAAVRVAFTTYTDVRIDYVANAAAYVAYAASAALDESLADFCEEVVQILIEMKTPGSQWL